MSKVSGNPLNRMEDLVYTAPPQTETNILLYQSVLHKSTVNSDNESENIQCKIAKGCLKNISSVVKYRVVITMGL